MLLAGFFVICHMRCHTQVVRTTLDIEDDLMTALMAHHPGASKREAVEAAIRDYLRRDSTGKLLAMAGNVQIEDVSSKVRKIDRHT